MLNSLAYHHDSLAQVIEQRVSQVVEQRIGQVVDIIRVKSENFPNRFESLYRRHPLANRRRASKASTTSKNAGLRSEGVGFRVNQYTSNYRPGCPCACHTQRKSSSPSFVDRVLGQTFVGYAGLPVISPKCNNTSCEKPQGPCVSVEYWFLLGFCWSQIVRLQVGYRQNVGQQFNLTTLRRVPDTAQCMEFALKGDIEGLKGLFKRGLASPWDVSSTRGFTTVRVCSKI
jgi:hypothetical protein